MQPDRRRPPARVRLDRELRVDDLQEEPLLALGEDLERRLAGELREQAVLRPGDGERDRRDRRGR